MGGVPLSRRCQETLPRPRPQPPNLQGWTILAESSDLHSHLTPEKPRLVACQAGGRGLEGS